MNPSITGFAYLILSVTLLFFIYRLFQYWKREKDVISKLWLYSIVLFLLFTLIKAIGGLFFTDNLVFLRETVYLGTFLHALILASMAYFVFYVKLPQISPWFGSIPIFVLGLIVTILTLNIRFNPFIGPSGAINWGIPASLFLTDVLRVFLYIIVFIPTIIILLQQFKHSESIYAKRKTMGLIIFFSLLVVVGLIDFLFTPIFKLDPIWRDIGFIFSSIILFISLVLTQKSPAVYSSAREISGL